MFISYETVSQCILYELFSKHFKSTLKKLNSCIPDRDFREPDWG